MRSLYLRAITDAMQRPVRGDPAAALQGFLTLNAAYFLGEWLPARAHARLVRRLAADLDGVSDLTVPAEEPTASQLAQHTRELAAAFGPSAWTERIVRMTAALVPATPEDWSAAVRPALAAAERGDDVLFGEMVDTLLLAHARRRLWELAHAGEAAAVEPTPPAWAPRLARRAAKSVDGRAVQAAEAALAEVVYGSPLLPPPPFPPRWRE